jgi:oxygen-independent coproporphyrinogen-3 oxidase
MELMSTLSILAEERRSLLMPEQVEKVLGLSRSKFSVSADAEITMEMNPATVTPASLAAYRGMGVNRASFGVQTFDDRALKLLARGSRC